MKRRELSYAQIISVDLLSQIVITWLLTERCLSSRDAKELDGHRLLGEKAMLQTEEGVLQEAKVLV